MQNLIGDGDERTATISLDGETAPPKVDLTGFKLEPAVPGQSALYRLQADVAGASHCILCAGDNRPLEIIDEPGHIDRIITFDSAGKYTFRLAAVNGKQVMEKTQDIQVGASEQGALLAKLKVSYEAVRVWHYTKTVHIHVGWMADLQDAVSAFRKERPIDADCTIVDLEVVNKNDAKAPRKLDCKPSPDKKKIVLTGELVRPTGLLTKKQTAPSWLAEVKATVERRSQPESVHRDDVTMAVAADRTVKVPLQTLGDHWELIRANVTLELWENGRMIWSGEPPVANTSVSLKSGPATLSAARQSDNVLVTITPTANVPAIPVVLPRPTPVELPPLPLVAIPPVAVVLPRPDPVTPVGPRPITLRIDFDPRRPFASATIFP